MRVTPRASRERIEVTPEGLVKVYVTAPPAEGEANAAVLKLLAKALRVPKTSLMIVRGAASREKRIRTETMTADEALARLAGR